MTTVVADLACFTATAAAISAFVTITERYHALGVPTAAMRMTIGIGTRSIDRAICRVAQSEEKIMHEIKPLEKRIMTLQELRKRTVRTLRLCRKQFLKAPHEPGLTDVEFIDEHINSLLTDIWQDRQMEKIIDEKAKTGS